MRTWKPLVLVSIVTLFGWAASVLPSFGAVTTSPPVPQASRLPQWEYVVVSGGKTYFSSALEGSLVGDSKAVVASGSTFRDEALELQHKMDGLGQLGWELVAVIGAIGGDQEFLFKRPYVKSVVDAEATIRHKQAGEMAALLAQIKQKPVSDGGVQIIDLDEKERLERLSSNMAQLENRLASALGELTSRGYRIEKNDLKALPRYATLNDEAVIAGTLVIDGTSQLLSAENTYRSSEARRLAKEICASMVRLALTSQYGSLPESIVVEITIKGKSVAKQSGHTFIGNELF